jgi:PAS domain-containing protein
LKLKPTEPLALHHSWFLYERKQRFDLGCVLDCRATEIRELAAEDELARHGVGRWQCDLAENALTWSDGVYDIFGLPRDARLTREVTVALYSEGSRAAMERLRAYAIRHKRGFTLDAEIRPGQGGPRWMRLIAAPILVEGHVVRLQGLKQII